MEHTLDFKEEIGLTDSSQESHSLGVLRFASTWQPTSPKILEIKTRYEARHLLQKTDRQAEANSNSSHAIIGSRDAER